MEIEVTITKYGLTFGSIYIEELKEWFWSVWDNQPLELSSPPLFFGFVKTFDEVKAHAEEYSLEAFDGETTPDQWEDHDDIIEFDEDLPETYPKQQANDYTRDFFEYSNDPENPYFLSKVKSGKQYLIVVWETFLSFLRNEEPIYFNKKADEATYVKCVKDFKIRNRNAEHGSGNFAKYYTRKLSAIEAEDKRPKSNDIDILEFLYSSDMPYDWKRKKNWFRHRIIKRTEKYIFVERLPYKGKAKLHHDWRKDVIFSARIDIEKFEKEGVFYSKTFEGWFCTYEKMQAQIKRDKASSKNWNEEIVIALPEDEYSWALEVYGLENAVTKSEMKKLYNGAAKKHHPDVGGKHEDFIKIKEAYDIIMEYYS